MTDNRTTELLQELRDLACDIHAAEIIDHVHITHRGWTFDSQWLDSWHAEFDRIADKLEQAIAATLGSGTCRIVERNGDLYCDACGEMVGTCDPASELFIDGNAVELWNYCPNCGKRVRKKVDE